MVQSPCLKICVIDPASEYCKGCHRTLPEIAQWGRMSATQQEKVLADVELRKKTFTQDMS